ncbi:MAG: hypothetical protein ACKOPO_09975 [Novosphingobium sp.]
MPISRHPLFAPMVALWFGALFGLGSLAIRPTLLESAVLAMRLDLAIPAAAPPLGFTFRILFALTMFVMGAAIGYLLVRRMTRPAKSESVIPSRSFMRKNSAAVVPAAPAVIADDIPDDDDFARLDLARIAQEKADNALPGRRRSLSLEKDFDNEHTPFSDFAPLPGGSPQILDLAELGPISEEEYIDAEPAVETAVADPVEQPEVHFAPVAKADEPDGQDEAEAASFDPWNRHPVNGYRSGADFASEAAPFAPAEPAPAPAPAFTAAQSQDFSAPAAQDFSAPATFAAPVPAYTPFPDHEIAEASGFAAPAAEFAAPAFAAPVDFAPPQDAAAFAAPAQPVADEASEAAKPQALEVLAAEPEYESEPEPEGEVAAELPAFGNVAAELPAFGEVAAELPAFGNVTGDAADRLVASPVDSLGVVQLAERLALAIARKREAAAPVGPAVAAPVAAAADAVVAPEPELPVMAAPSPPIPVVSPVPPVFAPPPAFAAPVADEAPVEAVVEAVVEAEAEPELEPEVKVEVEVEVEAEAVQPETVSASLFAAPTVPSAIPAALRPLSFDDEDEDDGDVAAYSSFLPPRGFGLAQTAPAAPPEEPVAPRQEFIPPTPPAPVAAPEESEDDGYGSLLGMNGASRTFVRIEEPVEEMPSIEPVVIFPGQDTRQAFGQAPAAAPANPAPHAGAGVGGRLFDAPSSPINGAIRQPLANAPAIDPQETERKLKAALATLQRMSGAA